MTHPAAGPRRYGTVFDGIAGDYDRHRPTYPDELLDQACRVGGLEPGDRVLEIGCGTGQLTRGLVARGLRVTAIEPGKRLAALAEQNLGAVDVSIRNTRFEDVPLPRGHFRAVFCASAMHWLEPEVSWRKAADVLVPGGLLALIQYFGLRAGPSADDQDAVLAGLRRAAPELMAQWPTYRDLEALLAGAKERRANVSELWGWLGGYDVARRYAGDLFGDAAIAVAPRLLEQSADELNALVRTMSYYARLSPSTREALERESRAVEDRLGRPIRSSLAAVLVTARRLPMSRASAMPYCRAPSPANR